MIYKLDSTLSNTKIQQEGPKGTGSLTWGKGHSEAIYRGPLILYTKYQGCSRFLP